MEEALKKAYRIVCYIFLFLFLYSLLQMKMNIYKANWPGGFMQVNRYGYTKGLVASAPVGVREYYRFTVTNIEGEYSHLFIHTAHQNVRIFVENQCIYSVEGKKGLMLWRSPGRLWNDIQLSEDYNGKRITVELTPVYKRVIGYPPVIYVGAKTDVHLRLLLSELTILLLGFMVAVTGCLFMITSLKGNKTDERNAIMRNMGFCFVLIGLLKFTANSFFGLISIKYPVFSVIPFWLLLLMCIPCTLLIKLMLGARDSLAWYVACFASLINIVIVCMAQLLNLADWRETLILTHATYVLSMVVVVGMIVMTIIKRGMNRDMLLTVVFSGGYLLWILTELFCNYINYVKGSRLLSIFGMLGFVIYVLELGWMTLKEAKSMMAVGMQAKQFERKAFHDQLTGFYNRAAFAEYIGNEGFVPEGCIIAVFDLNNLKKCNDSLGHEQGDVYIRESARIIRECFGDIGQCYRQGGDEFAVIIPNGSMWTCKERVTEMEEKVRHFNRNGSGIEMGIACGYEEFDDLVDTTIEDTAKRADQRMYQMKNKMKQCQQD